MILLFDYHVTGTVYNVKQFLAMNKFREQKSKCSSSLPHSTVIFIRDTSCICTEVCFHPDCGVLITFMVCVSIRFEVCIINITPLANKGTVENV